MLLLPLCVRREIKHGQKSSRRRTERDIDDDDDDNDDDDDDRKQLTLSKKTLAALRLLDE